MIKRILNWFGYVSKERLAEANELIDAANAALKLNLDSIMRLNAKLAKQAKEHDKLVLRAESKIKKLNQNNIRLLKKQGEFKEKIKALEEKLNGRQSED